MIYALNLFALQHFDSWWGLESATSITKLLQCYQIPQNSWVKTLIGFIDKWLLKTCSSLFQNFTIFAAGIDNRDSPDYPPFLNWCLQTSNNESGENSQRSLGLGLDTKIKPEMETLDYLTGLRAIILRWPSKHVSL